MTKIEHKSHLEKLHGSEQHYDLKNQPGDAGDPDHADTNNTLSKELSDAVKDGDADTALADELKKAAG